MALGVLGVLVAGCTPSATEEDFDSAVPGARIYATRRAAQENDRGAIRDLIEGLDSDDPAIRFMSIHTLERMTGETYGYRHFDPPWARDEAVSLWVEAFERGDLANGEPSGSSGAREPADGGAG